MEVEAHHVQPSELPSELLSYDTYILDPSKQYEEKEGDGGIGREVGRIDSCYFCLVLGGRGRFRPPPQRTPPPLEVQGYASSSVQLAAALVARACVD